MAAKYDVRYRYSVAKARRLLAYTESTSTARHLAVLVGYLLPAAIASLIPTFVTLQDPMLGTLHNPGFFVHGMLTTLSTIAGATLQARAVTSISHREFSTLQVMVVAVVGGVHFWIIMGLLGIYWRFPVPFTMVLGAVPYVLSMMWAIHIVVRPRAHVRTRLLMYLPSHATQVSQIFAYPIFSALFEATDQTGQIVLIVLFPICKYCFRRAIAIVSHLLGDFQREVSIAGVEICASIYQTTIMQNTPTLVSGVLIVLVDVIQGLIDVRRFLSTDPAAFSRALDVLQDDSMEITDARLNAFASSHVGLWRSIRHACVWTLRGRTMDVVPVNVVSVIAGPKRQIATTEDIKLRELVQTLEVLQSMETILLVEYIETLSPIVNTLYLVASAQLTSAIYNPRVREFYGDHTALKTAVGSVVVYLLLQAATLAAICLLVRRRYQLSALGVLAFVLETHAWSLQGKLVAWFTFMFAFTVVHYGRAHHLAALLPHCWGL